MKILSKSFKVIQRPDASRPTRYFLCFNPTLTTVITMIIYHLAGT